MKEFSCLIFFFEKKGFTTSGVQIAKWPEDNGRAVGGGDGTRGHEESKCCVGKLWIDSTADASIKTTMERSCLTI